VYLKLGMKLVSTGVPNYRYVKGTMSFSRVRFQKHKLKELFPDQYAEGKTEVEIMLEAGYYRVFDCGSSVFTK